METPDQSSGVISSTAISQSGEIVLAKFEALTSHTTDSTTQLSTEQIGEQVLGYLEVQPSEVQLVQDSNTIYLQPQEIEIDGEHLILTQGEEAGEIIVVVSTDQEHSTDQAVAELAQGTVVNATMMHSESGDNKPRMFVVNQSNAQFDVVNNDGKMTSIQTNVESDQLAKSAPEQLLIPAQNKQTENNIVQNIDGNDTQSDNIKSSVNKKNFPEPIENTSLQKNVSNSEEESRDRKLMELACLAQEMRKEENCTNKKFIEEKEILKDQQTYPKTVVFTKTDESTSTADNLIKHDTMENTSNKILKDTLTNSPETAVTGISESSNVEMSTINNPNQNLEPELEETENVRDLQQDNIALDEFSQISQNDQSVPNEASLLNIPENSSLIVPDKLIEQNPISPDSAFSQGNHQITNMESQYGESQCINVSETVENNKVLSSLEAKTNKVENEKNSVESFQIENKNNAIEIDETCNKNLNSNNKLQADVLEDCLSKKNNNSSISEQGEILQCNNATSINELNKKNQTETNKLEIVNKLTSTKNEEVDLTEFNINTVKNNKLESVNENSEEVYKLGNTSKLKETNKDECKKISTFIETTLQSKADSQIIEETLKCVQDVVNTTEKILTKSTIEIYKNEKIEEKKTENPVSSQSVKNENSFDSNSDQVVPQIEVTDITEKDVDIPTEIPQEVNLPSSVQTDNIQNIQSSEKENSKKMEIKQQQKNIEMHKNISIIEKNEKCEPNSDHGNKVTVLESTIQAKNIKICDNVKDKNPAPLVMQYISQDKKRNTKSIKTDLTKDQNISIPSRSPVRQKQGRYPVVIHLRDSIAKTQPEKIQNEINDKTKSANKVDKINQIEEKVINVKNSAEKISSSTDSNLFKESEKRESFKEQKLNEKKENSSECAIDKLNSNTINNKLNNETEKKENVVNEIKVDKIIEKDEELDEIIDEGLRRSAEIKQSRLNMEEKKNLNIIENRKDDKTIIQENTKENDVADDKDLSKTENTQQNESDNLKIMKDNSCIENELTLQIKTTLLETDVSSQNTDNVEEKSECLTPKIQKQFQLLISPEKSDIEVDLTSIKSKISQKLQYDSISESNDYHHDTEMINEEQMELSECKNQKIESEIKISVEESKNDMTTEIQSEKLLEETPKRRGRKRKSITVSKPEKKTQKIDITDIKTTDKDQLEEKPKRKGRKRKNETDLEQNKQQKLDFDKLTEKKTNVDSNNKQTKSPVQKSWFLRPRGASTKESLINSFNAINEKIPNVLNPNINNENKLNEQPINQTSVKCHSSMNDTIQNITSSSVPQDQLNDDSDKSEISEDQVSRPVLMTRNEFLNSSSLSPKGKNKYSKRHLKSKSVTLSVQKAQSPRKYSPKSKTEESSISLQRKKQIRSRTEPSLCINSEMKESFVSPVKMCDFRIRCQTPSTPSEKSLTYSCVGCRFQTSRVQNLIHHYREKCLYTGPDAFHWDVDQLEGAKKEESLKSKENIINTKHIIDASNKSAITSRIQNSTKRQIKSGNSMEKPDNSDSDFDDLPPAFDTPSKKKYGFTDDDVVWVEWKNLHWPALVRKIYMKQKKASIMFIDSPCGKKPGIRVPIKKISTFDNAERNKKFLSAGRLTSNADTLVKAVQKAEDFLRKRCLGINITSAQFFGNLDDFSDYISDIGSSTGTLSEPDSLVRERHLSEVSSSRSVSPALRLTQEEQAKDNEIMSNDSTEISDPEALARRKERRKHQNAKLLQCIKAGKIETHLVGVYRNTIPSERHKLFHSSVASERNKLKHVSWFGPIDDEEQQEEIYDYCLQLFKSSCEYKETFDVVAYMFEVWVPEAIVRAIARVRRVKMIQAESIFSKGVNWSKAEKEEVKREFENFQLTEEERQEHRENMADSLRNAGVEEDVIQSLNL